MANNEDSNQANTGAPAADIPDLKKKDKERKKAGAAWSGAKPGAGSFSGATGGTVSRAAASAAGIGGEAAAAAAAEAAGVGAGGFFGSISSFLSGLAATLAGKMAIAAAAILLLAGGAMIAAGLLKGGGAAGDGAMGDLGALSSSMKVRMGGSDRTGVASNGEIAFDPVNGGAAKPAEKAAAPADAAPAGNPANPLTPQPEENKDAGFNRPGLEHNMSGSKLSSSLGGGFGAKNIFSGGNASNKLGDAMGKFNIKGGEKGRLSATRAANRTGKVQSGTSTRGMKANRAFGQLKAGARNSMIGAGANGAEAAKNGAAAAFDGGTLGGSTVGGPPGAAPTGEVTSPSNPGGAPDTTMPSAPTVPTQDLGAVTAAAIAAIAQMAQAAAKMKMMGMALIVVGLALVAAGCTIWTAWLIPIGLAIAAMGYMMVQQSEKLKAQADAMSQQLAERTTDQRQNAINKYCIDKAYAGTPPANCNPPDDLTGKQDFKKATEDGKKNNDRIIREDGRVEGDTGKAL